MKNTNRLGKIALFLTFLLVFVSQNVISQVQTARYITINSDVKGFYEYLPEGYNTGNQTYPLLLFFHGAGERGDGSPSQLPLVLRNGVPKMINEGTFPTSFAVNGQTFRYIVISPQFVDVPTQQEVDDILDYAIQHYRVNVNRVYLTGLSMGGGIIFLYLGQNSTYANRIAAMVPIAEAYGYSINIASNIAQANIAVWATHNDGDPVVSPVGTINYVNGINSFDPPNRAKLTLFHSTSHDAWTKTYDLNFTEDGLNVFEWMLQFQRGTAPAPNIIPTANAGTDKTITLPTNSVALSGTGSDPDGTISTYSWSKIAGPSQFTISNSSITAPLISNLVAGTYTFRLTVTDNDGASDFDDMNIIVNPEPSSVTGSQRILIDAGMVSTTGPDQWGKYWNNMISAQPGIQVSNAQTTTNTETTIGLEVINRIDGTFGTSGPGLNSGNTTGVVGDYPASATTDYAFAHHSTTIGKWRIFGLNALKQYSIKFWGTKSATADYTIQIKRSDQTTWQEYNASNNNNFNTAAVFTFSGLPEMSFDIRTKSESDGFGYINVIDIQSTDQVVTVSQQSATVDEVATNNSSSIYPNPVKDQFVLKVNNNYTGIMNVRIIDQKGSVAKEFTSTKNNGGSTQLFLSAKGLPAGIYFIRVQIAKWTQSIQMIKQ